MKTKIFIRKKRKFSAENVGWATAQLYCNIGWLGAGLCRNTVHCIVTKAGLDCIATQSLNHDTALGRGAGRAAGRAGRRWGDRRLGASGRVDVSGRAGVDGRAGGRRAGRRRAGRWARACWASGHRRGRRAGSWA